MISIILAFIFFIMMLYSSHDDDKIIYLGEVRMKNKRYKRLAKRIKGECILKEFDDCCIEFETCPYSGFCGSIIVPLDERIPMIMTKKKLESIIKKNNNNKTLFID